MKKPLVILSLLMTFVLTALAQDETRIRREPVPTYPPIGKPITEEISDNTSSMSPGPVSTGFRTPSGASSLSLGVPVNLYTGTPQLDIPIYTLSEGRLNLPLYLSYNLASIKPHTVASFTGLGFDLKGIPTIRRMVRGMPDEGFTYNGQGLKGYYYWGTPSNATDPNHDKEPDYFFIETPSGSGKFMFDRSRRVHFLPQSDVKVVVAISNSPNETGSNHFAKRFDSFTVTFPDGIKYTFEHFNNESSAEVEVKQAQSSGHYPGANNFSQFLKNSLHTHSWFCSKMESPYGEVINFSYDRVTYTYYKPKENEGLGFCPIGSGMDKKINKVYVRASQIREITSSNLKVRFNSANRSCFTDNSVSPSEQVCTTSNIRTDLDNWANTPINSSLGKKLDDIIISDNEPTPAQKLVYTFEYDYFNASDYGLPSGYSYSDIGTSHQKRLVLKKINTPESLSYSFSYDSEHEVMSSRLTYGIDHWGYSNGRQDNFNNPSGFVGENSDPNPYHCGSDRQPNFLFAKKGVLTKIENSIGNRTTLEYEENKKPEWYSGNPIVVGGLRIKSITQKDSLRNSAQVKKYTYTMPNNESSGITFLEPNYRVSYKNSNSQLIYFSHSTLFQSLLAESGRPEVAYKRVIEESASFGNSPSYGKVVTEFDMNPNTGSMGNYSLIGCPDCETSPVFFNLSHDFRQGNVKKQEVYNQSHQLISKTEMSYSPGDGIKSDSTFAIKYYNSTYSFPGASGSHARAIGYNIHFNKFRLKSQTTTLFSPDGTGTPSVSTIQYTYKDEMPAAYINKYKGKHHMPVKTNSTDEEGNVLESRVLYTADFSFDMDTIIVCPEFSFCSQIIDLECPRIDCQEEEITSHVPPYGNDARGIFEANNMNIITPIENRQIVNGQTINANYTSLTSSSGNGLALPKAVYSMKTIPNGNLSDPFYDKPNTTMVKDLDYGTLPVSEILSYNTKGHPVETKVNKGTLTKTSYLNPTVVNSSTRNFGKPDALVETLDFGKIYLGANKVTAANLLEKKIEKEPSSGRLLLERDKENRIINQYQYNLTLNATSSITWNWLSPIKICIGSNATFSLTVDGVLPSSIAQFSIDGGATWNNANIGNNGYYLLYPSGSGTLEIQARSSDNPSITLSKHLDVSCLTPVPFGWGANIVSYEPPNYCIYNLKLVGLSPTGVGQFSGDGLNFFNGTPISSEFTFILYQGSGTQQFWARDSNNPTNVITVNLNVCQP